MQPTTTSKIDNARGFLDRITGSARRSRIYSIEGPRGSVTRGSIWLKYIGFFFAIMIASLMTHGLLHAAQTTESGGKFMLFSAAFTTVTAVLGTVFYPNHRNEIIREMRHYLFGMCLLPATGIATIIWAMQSMLHTSTAQKDTMMQLLQFSVPVIFVCTLIIPPAIFVKYIAGIGSINRAQFDDEEMMSTYTRQDRIQH